MRLRYDDDFYIVVVKEDHVLNYQWYFGHQRYGKFTKLASLPPRVQQDIRNNLAPYNIQP